MKKRSSILFVVMAVSVLLLVAVFGTGMVIAKTENPVTRSFKSVATSEQEQKNNDADHYKEMEAKCEEQLNSAVETGKYTSEQKQAILKKEAGLHQDMTEIENLSPGKRGEDMVKMMSEMESWAKDNGIDLEDFMGMSMDGGCSPEMMQGMDSMMNGKQPMMSGGESMM